MGSEILILIGALGGALIGVGGQIIGNWINHKKELERIKTELVLKEKIESYKKVHKILYKIKRKTIDFLVEVKKDKEDINELILKLNNESFLFPSSKTMDKIKEGSILFQDIINNPPEITIIESGKIKINRKSLNKFIFQLGNAKGEILKAMRKELGIK